MFGAYEKFWGKDAKVVVTNGKPHVIPKPRTPKPDAFEKRLAAEAAPRLCERFGVKPTTTKDGQFCRLAALLYGDERADVQHHCREARKRGKKNP